MPRAGPASASASEGESARDVRSDVFKGGCAAGEEQMGAVICLVCAARVYKEREGGCLAAGEGQGCAGFIKDHSYLKQTSNIVPQAHPPSPRGASALQSWPLRASWSARVYAVARETHGRVRPLCYLSPVTCYNLCVAHAECVLFLLMPALPLP